MRGLEPPEESFVHSGGSWGHGIRVGRIQSLHCGGGSLELWSEGHQCRSWRQFKNTLVDASEEGGLSGLSQQQRGTGWPEELQLWQLRSKNPGVG